MGLGRQGKEAELVAKRCHFPTRGTTRSSGQGFFDCGVRDRCLCRRVPPSSNTNERAELMPAFPHRDRTFLYDVRSIGADNGHGVAIRVGKENEDGTYSQIGYVTLTRAEAERLSRYLIAMSGD